MNFSHVITDNVRKACNVIRVAAGDARLAGGAVRDALLGLQPKDLDLATTLPPEIIVDIFTARGHTVFPFGIKHGTVGVVVNGETIEITTLRIDRNCDGRHAEVQFTSDWKLDAERRDFTFNAMFLDIDGNLYDYFDGQSDLNRRIVRFVGDANARIQEDYLRILRYFRFLGKIDGSHIDYDAAVAMHSNLDGLEGISGERIWLEMQKILSGRNRFGVLRLMRDRDVLPHIGLTDLFNPIRAATVVRSIGANNPITALAAGLQGDTVAADRVIERWKLNNDEARLLSYIVLNWKEFGGADYLHNLPTARWWKDEIVRRQHASNRDPKGEKQLVLELASSLGSDMLLRELTDWEEPKFPVTGRDLEGLGLTPGPNFGKILEMLRIEWTQSDYAKPKSELLGLVQNLTV
jgi:tRNA nucleotidyltransferase (CCA-adding enzyme)